MMNSSSSSTNPNKATISAPTPSISSNPITTTIDESLDPNIKSHPWTEWPQLVTNLKRLGYFDRPSSQKLLRSEFTHDDFRLCPKYFLQAASACLFFAKEHPQLIDSLSRDDITQVVKYGLPFYFKGCKTEERMSSFVRGDQKNESKELLFIPEGLSPIKMLCLYVYMQQNMEERMKSLAHNDQKNASEADRAHTVDLMRYLLNEVYKESFSSGPGRCGPAPYRNLLKELVHETRVVEDPDDSAS
ncbi:hypothetical protein ACHQM5_019308 [Ranunculus cassubicifolius]